MSSALASKLFAKLKVRKRDSDENLRQHDASPPIPIRPRARSLCVASEAGQVLASNGLRLATHAEKCQQAVQRRKSSTATMMGASEFLSKRGAFSRRQYGSIEMLQESNREAGKGGDPNSHSQLRRFRVETGSEIDEQSACYPSTMPVLENPEFQTRWYFKYFLGKVHQNYAGVDTQKEPFFLSVLLADTQGTPAYRVILWRKTGSTRICLTYNPSKPLTMRQLLGNFPALSKVERAPREVLNADIQKDLLILEEQEGSVNFKFGVLYMKSGQRKDEEMYNNETSSPQFEKFLSILGDKIRLKGWDKYRGGLDVRSDMTGRHSYHTVYEGHEIMFHVSTLLPFTQDQRQQIERKRHIGNDIVNIIFLEGPPSEMAEFKANVMRSHFTHIIALVTALEGGGYRLSVHTDESVPLFGPVLPSPPVFHDLRNFRDFLLVKLINGEKAAFNSPIFAEKRTRTLDHLLRSMYDAYHNSEKALPMLSRRALSDVVEAPQRIIRRKEEARRVDFVRIGQAMKLDTIVRGDAPTSLATSSLVRSSPWDAKCIFPDFPFEVQCGDTWEDDGLLLATENGVYSINGESHQLKLVLDKTVQGKQLNVIEQHGIVILRSEKGREGRIYVLPVGLFELDEDAPGLNGTMDTAWSKSDIRDYKIPQSRGCHLYALSKAENPNVKLAVAIGKRLLLYQWKHSAAWSELLTDSEASAHPNGFQCLREFTLSEIPSMVTLIENGPQDQPLICLSVKNSFEILVERSGETYTLFSLEKARLISAQEVCEDEEPEILLSYNHSCHVQKLEPAIGENHKPQLSIQWNSAPETVVAVFPYLLSFGEDTLEVRLIINGNLLASTALPNLKFLTSKTDIVYLTTAPEFVDFQRTTVLMDRPESECSRSASPNSPDPPQKTSPSTQHPPVQQTISSSLGSSNSLPYRIYKIPFTSLAGIQPSLLPQEYLLHGQEWTPRRVSVSVSRSCSSSPLPPTPP